MNDNETPAEVPVDRPVRQIAPGDIVRVKDPDQYLAEFARKIADRDAVVLWVGPTANGMFHNRTKVRFLKRNGRGKEFEELIHTRELVLQPNASK